MKLVRKYKFRSLPAGPESLVSPGLPVLRKWFIDRDYLIRSHLPCRHVDMQRFKIYFWTIMQGTSLTHWPNLVILLLAADTVEKGKTSGCSKTLIDRALTLTSPWCSWALLWNSAMQWGQCVSHTARSLCFPPRSVLWLVGEATGKINILPSHKHYCRLLILKNLWWKLYQEVFASAFLPSKR